MDRSNARIQLIIVSSVEPPPPATYNLRRAKYIDELLVRIDRRL